MSDYAIKLSERTCGALIDGISGYEGEDSLIRDARSRSALVRRKCWVENGQGKLGLGEPTQKGIAYSHAAQWHFLRDGNTTKFKSDPKHVPVSESVEHRVRRNKKAG